MSCTSTSNIDSSSVSGSMPCDIVRFPCGSMSIHRTRCPSSAKAAARFSVVVVLATPPFWLAKAITLATARSVRSRRNPSGLLVRSAGILRILRLGVRCRGSTRPRTRGSWIACGSGGGVTGSVGGSSGRGSKLAGRGTRGCARSPGKSADAPPTGSTSGRHDDHRTLAAPRAPADDHDRLRADRVHALQHRAHGVLAVAEGVHDLAARGARPPRAVAPGAGRARSRPSRGSRGRRPPRRRRRSRARAGPRPPRPARRRAGRRRR